MAMTDPMEMEGMDAGEIEGASELTDDKRIFERFAMEVPALLESLKPGKRMKMALRTTNLSAGGAYFHTSKPLPKGAEVKVEISLRDEGMESWTVITVTGRVARSEPKGMSLVFLEDYEIASGGHR